MLQERFNNVRSTLDDRRVFLSGVLRNMQGRSKRSHAAGVYGPVRGESGWGNRGSKGTGPETWIYLSCKAVFGTVSTALQTVSAQIDRDFWIEREKNKRFLILSFLEVLGSRIVVVTHTKNERGRYFSKIQEWAGLFQK
ncbi:hypothetical protein TNCT_189111 [Trichonephila clavata]|uniref:Uncharacterized protein n=1 Tax=Trichonephila clavata TaxID=2740835 RepID=A0A8X6F873_TRICU|nr:hypothetical protein TNCT_189111 [Trichonephila clavata]